MKNVERALHVLTQLKRSGVKHLVLCPGGRNAPITELLSQDHHPFVLHNHFDERSASFYALGLAQSEHAPVAVITTSGTAVSETLSACIEAHYSSTPLIILSADRPKTYRGSGAPQSIRQADLLKTYCSKTYDIENESETEAEALNIKAWDQCSPLHINVCFDEPLLEKELNISLEGLSKEPVTTPERKPSKSFDQDRLKLFLSKVKKPLVIVSGSFGFEKELVQDFIAQTKAPVFLESTSGLKSHASLSSVEIEFPELLFASHQVDGVLRIGHVPTHRCWRDLEALKLPVLNFSHNPFSGLSWEKDGFDLQDLNEVNPEELKHPELALLIEEDRIQGKKREQLLSAFPNSEPALIRSLQNQWNEDELVYLGNSLPIREWDYVSLKTKNFSQVAASRGANGIDGQISTFLGRARNEPRSLGLFGDLTCLYDMNAPWFLRSAKGVVHIAVINNSGGMIFDRMFGKDIYLNKHNLSFEALAKMWDLDFQLYSPTSDPFTDNHSGLIEIKPNAKETNAFWEAMK